MENMNAKDLRIEIHSMENKGGQTVGEICQRVCVEHLPTGIRASCDYERSLVKNRTIALAMIEYGLAELGYVEEGK